MFEYGYGYLFSKVFKISIFEYLGVKKKKKIDEYKYEYLKIVLINTFKYSIFSYKPYGAGGGSFLKYHKVLWNA